MSFYPSIRISLVLFAFSLPAFAAPQAEPWQSPYTGNDATGDHVIAFWNFEGEGDSVEDASGQGHDGALTGAQRNSDGRFGAGLETFAGWPVEDVRHAVQVPDAADLSPRGAFTVELWLRPAEQLTDYAEAFLLDKKYVAHEDFQWILGAPDASGLRQMRVVLGFGEESDTWYSTENLAYVPGTWYHVAITYDGAGTVQFLRDGRSIGKTTKPRRGPITPGAQGLSIGDRIGSLYHGFPGTIDEVRLTSGVRDFRPLAIAARHLRTAYQRMGPNITLTFALTNLRQSALAPISAEISLPGMPGQSFSLPELAPGASEELSYTLDTRMRPDSYEIEVHYRIGEGEDTFEGTERFPVTIVARKPPHQMPVVMWGVGGVEGVTENLPKLKELGFTHCLGLRCDFDTIWQAGAPAPAQDERNLAASYRMLDEAFANDLGVIISLGVGHWLDAKPEVLRVDREGKPYERVNPCCQTPGLLDFSKNVGVSVAQSYGDFPAFQAALINTEVRDSSQVCFHDHDRAACREATGHDIPALVTSKNGVHYGDLPDFPADRVVADDHELLQFYRWFWKEGDGWNAMHSAVHDGLQTAGRSDFWTFFDPAVRVPSVWGSGGHVDYLSHWTYSYPDPLRMGLATDELFAMADGREGQDVMKMTQIIWYRSQTAPPAESSAAAPQSAWEDYDPDAAYITIAPAHLREAFWHKIARPIKGIMYHGWQSLVPTEGTSAYRYTHPETQRALKELTETVVKPLGPTLLQVPAAQADVAFLESFTSEIFAGRGTYGWGGSWAGDAYHILLYAGLQPEIIFEETIQQRGLDAFRILVLTDCDVLPRSVVDAILAFQQRGGIIVGDERLCPAIGADVTLPIYSRTKQADADKAALQTHAVMLREQLAGRYAATVSSSNPDVLVYRRHGGKADYVFAVNDNREYGTYVGNHGLVMENGLPAAATIALPGHSAHAYDLVKGYEVPLLKHDGGVSMDVQLEPGGGQVFLVTQSPIAAVQIHGPDRAKPGDTVGLNITVVGDEGVPVEAVIPVELDVRDPDGRPAEYCGHYGAKDGALRVELTLAPNDTPGVWTVRASESASGMTARHFFRVAP